MSRFVYVSGEEEFEEAAEAHLNGRFGRGESLKKGQPSSTKRQSTMPGRRGKAKAKTRK